MSVALKLLLAAALTTLGAEPTSPPDWIPLAIPSAAKSEAPALTAVQTPKEKTAPAHEPLPRAWSIGLSAQAAVVSGSLRGGGGAVLGLGYQLPLLGRRLGLRLEPGFVFLVAGQSGGAGVTASVPLGASYAHPAGRGHVTFTALASLDFVSAQALADNRAYLDRYFTVGAMAGVGYLWPMGPGGIDFNLRYRALAYAFLGQRQIGHGVVVSAGYSYFP